MSFEQHETDADGYHSSDDCRLCLEQQSAVESECRCGNCCRMLILEADLRDTQREPRIAAECRPLRDIGTETVGYLLNDRRKNMACHFLDEQTNRCTIYESRPLMCRLFSCDQARADPDSPVFDNSDS